jgi:hypothetical protein
MALQLFQRRQIAVELLQQAAADFHVCHPGQGPTGPGLGHERAPLGTPQADEAAAAAVASEQLNPAAGHHAPHGKTKEIHRLLSPVAGLDFPG